MIELRQALGALRRAPVFSGAAILTLGLGVGLNAAVFGALYGIVLRPVAVPGAERVVAVWQDLQGRGGTRTERGNWAMVADLQARSRSFDAVAGFSRETADLADTDPPQNVEAARVSRDLFSILGIRPVLGRRFGPQDEVRGDDRVVILGYDLWRRGFGGDPSVVGRTISVDGVRRTVVGILPGGRTLPVLATAEVWIPMWFRPAPQDWGVAYVTVVGRLRQGVSLAAEEGEVARVARDAAAEHPNELHGVGMVLEPWREALAGSATRPLVLLLAATVLLLLIACFNVTNLFLSRAEARQAELALRLALGAGRRRLLRLFVAESLWLAAGAAAIGLGLGALYLVTLRGMAPPQTPRLDAVRLDTPVIAATFVVAFAITLAAGMASGAWAARRSPFAALRGARGAGQGRSALGLRGALVTAEVAASLVLLLGAGIFLRSLWAVARVDPGFAAARLVLGHLTVMPAHPPDLSDVVAFGNRLVERLEQRPEIAAAGLVSDQPLAAPGFRLGFGLDGQAPAAEQGQAADFRLVSPSYPRALGLPVVAGRPLAASDTAGAAPVALVNQRFVRLFLGGRDPLEHRIRSVASEGPQAPWRRIVGVVGDVHGRALDQAPDPEIYVPLAQQPGLDLTVVARARLSTAAALAALRDTVAEVKPGQILARPGTLADVVDRGLAPRRFTAGLIVSFAVVALLLAAVGIYGVTALAVGQRRNEFAVRMALGAEPAAVTGLILRWSAVLVGAGIVLGVAGALAAQRAVASLLFGVSPLDGVALGAAVAFLGVVALGAAVLPAQSVRRMNVARVLRGEG
jgi:predicted permease